MTRSCPTCPVRFNDETVAACPKCRPTTGVMSSGHAAMAQSCASCNLPFGNVPKWWDQHGNYCPDCVRDKLNPRTARRKAPERRIPRGKWEQMYVEAYDKFPTTLELAQFKEGMLAKKAARAMDKGGEE